MSTCSGEKYNVLENIMKETIYWEQYIRMSYIQEIMNAWQKEYVTRVIVLYIT